MQSLCPPPEATATEQGGVDLHSCNCVEIRDRMKVDGTLSNHGTDWEKVLGYQYSHLSDMQHVTPIVYDANASTKRQILTEVSKLFDQLSLYLPVFAGLNSVK